LIVAVIVAGICLAFGYPHDIVLAPLIELLLLAGTNHVKRRSDALAYITHYG
jgi:hypothetical protein